jgi:D-sedoheptulose 7-phosphate isomerase
LVPEIETAAGWLVDALRQGGKVLVFGNGGSAADSQHLAAELVGRFETERPGLAALALTTDTSIITALGNDYGVEAIFARQVEALGRAKDVAVAISTSGNSAGVLAGVKAAQRLEILVVGLTGSDGGKLAETADLAIRVPSSRTARIQEGHIAIIHALCEVVDAAFTSR